MTQLEKDKFALDLMNKIETVTNDIKGMLAELKVHEEEEIAEGTIRITPDPVKKEGE